MYQIKIADAVVATGQTAAIGPAGAAQQSARIQRRCHVYAECNGGTPTATVVVQGRPLGGTQWVNLATINCAPADRAVAVTPWPEMRVDVTALGGGTTLDAWVMFFEE